MIDKVCKHLGITKEQILDSRVTDDSVIVVVDYGISGGKKFEVAKADLEAIQKPETAEDEPKPAATKKAAKKPASKKEAK